MIEFIASHSSACLETLGRHKGHMDKTLFSIIPSYGGQNSSKGMPQGYGGYCCPCWPFGVIIDVTFFVNFLCFDM